MPLTAKQVESLTNRAMATTNDEHEIVYHVINDIGKNYNISEEEVKRAIQTLKQQ